MWTKVHRQPPGREVSYLGIAKTVPGRDGIRRASGPVWGPASSNAQIFPEVTIEWIYEGF
jgi:hypothetical protein